ncbi:type II secretion system F family protein [Niveibacterium umoris]|uniref:Type IV pilus assembly protein PilC n=1 Tax=Niveibacterium umoris TaxID=1193620 RepID=A0A840BHP7_9RHOO|nr:type II secretion system F family protein [Niveibacterium umoris]MBB4012755.1 type IV pilus assembly protein PilC [Niveibacterium umoris]
MAVFAYRAMNRTGRVIRGEMEAVNLVDLELRLRRMDLDFINGEAARTGVAWRRGRIPRRELMHFCFHLEQLTRAGVPILESLCDLRDSTVHARFREIVAGLVESIEGGRSLSQAMQEQPTAFDSVFCALIRAGEATGNLPEVLDALNESLKRDDELASYTQRLVIYPSIVVSVILGAITVSMVYVVPELSKLFVSTGQALPFHTRALIAVSHVVSQHGWWLALLLVGSVIGLRIAAINNTNLQMRIDRAKLSAPLFGEVYRKIILARFASLFSMMYGSGIAIIDSVRIAQDVAGNKLVQRALIQVEQHIAEGQNVTSAFGRVGLFPPLVTRMLRIGENTGALDKALQNVSYFYERDVRESIARVQTMMEPILTLLLGSLLLWVMLSVLGPIYDIITRMKV